MAEANDDIAGGEKRQASDINQTAKNANDAGGFRDDKLAGETINGGTLPVPVYQNTADNEFYACDANDTAKLNFVGFAISSSIDGVAIDLQMTGIVRGFTGLDEGEKYYVQDAAGTIGKAKGTYEILVGIAISATELLILKKENLVSFDLLGKNYFVYQIPPVVTLENFAAVATDIGTGYGGFFKIDDSGGSATYVQWFLPGQGTVLNLQFDDTKKVYMSAKVRFGGANNNIDSGGFGFGGNARQDIDLADLTASIAFTTSRVLGVDKIFTKTSDGSTVESNELTDISYAINKWFDLMIEWTPGVSAKFYVNGVLKFTHTTNIPSPNSDIYGWFSQAEGKPAYCSAIQIAIER